MASMMQHSTTNSVENWLACFSGKDCQKTLLSRFFFFFFQNYLKLINRGPMSISSGTGNCIFKEGLLDEILMVARFGRFV
jgi:hypothetical protein